MNITATQLKQETHLLTQVEKEDIVITKRSKPFAVIIEYEKYKKLINESNKSKLKEKLDALNSLESFHLGGKDHKEIKSEAKI